MLNVSLGNREAWLGDGPELAAVAPYFQFQMPGYQFTPQYAKGWDGYVKYLQNGQLPTGLFLTYRRLIETEECVQFRVHDERTWPRVDRAALEELTGGKTKAYDYQIECVRRMVKHRRTGGIVLNATGSGKTFITVLQGAPWARCVCCR